MKFAFIANNKTARQKSFNIGRTLIGQNYSNVYVIFFQIKFFIKIL
jgi:hypothetical protein